MAVTVCLLLLSIGSCLATVKGHLGDVPMENPDLFGGDMLGLDDPEDRNAVPTDKMLWPGGIIPYTIDPAYDSTLHLKIFRMTFNLSRKMYEQNTCLRFVERTTEEDYVRIFPGQGCYSNVGRTGGAQPLSIGHGCIWVGTIAHELGHAIGFYHEQNRSDRDDWITILWENIKEGMEDQFFKLKPHQNRLVTPFDYDSLMLYGSYTFSKDRKKLMTMVGKNNRFLQDVIIKYKLSKGDYERVNKLYNCKV